MFAGFIVVIMATIAGFFIQMPALQIVISAGIILLMTGFILFDTSRIVNGGETNYVMATVGLFLSIYNIFHSLLMLLGLLVTNNHPIKDKSEVATSEPPATPERLIVN